MINGSGIFDFTLAVDANIGGFDQAVVTELTGGASAGEVTPIGGLTSIPFILNTAFTALVSVLFIVPLLTSIGVPSLLAICIQGPIYAVYVFDLLNWVGNRPQNQ